MEVWVLTCNNDDDDYFDTMELITGIYETLEAAQQGAAADAGAYQNRHDYRRGVTHAYTLGPWVQHSDDYVADINPPDPDEDDTPGTYMIRRFTVQGA